ncbi:MAG: twin-arginine translocase TatA/TatE family subunit [Spirochaetes bacterium]|nr:MAG: twin-arginine translocase TatA/TatE family subunit [Spirochaetota bacterium]
MVGTTEILIIAGVVLVLFGGAAIPKFARSIGKARREFEKGIKEEEEDEKKEAESTKDRETDKGTEK